LRTVFASLRVNRTTAIAILIIVSSSLCFGESTANFYDALRDNLVADGKTDNSGALNNAIANAIAGGYGTVLLPCGQIMVAKAINLTNRSNLTLLGCGSNQEYGGAYSKTNTQIRCNTGAVCVDTTGSSRITLKDFSLRVENSFKSPSTVGVLLGRDNAGGGGSHNPYCFAQFNTLDNLFVFMDSHPGLKPRGSVAVYNVSAEHFTIRGGKYIADQSLELSSTNILGIESSYQKLADGCPASMTIISVGEAASFQSWNYFPVEFNHVLDADFAMVYYSCGKPSSIAVNFNTGQNKKISMRGQVEGCSQFGNANTHLDHNTFDVLVVQPNKPLFSLDAGVKVTSSTFRISQEHGEPQVLFSVGSGSVIAGSYVDLGTLAGVNSPGIKTSGSIVLAPGLDESKITFAAGSNYLLLTDSGTKTIGTNKETGVDEHTGQKAFEGTARGKHDVHPYVRSR
jgi:hypothetical protein